MQFKQGDVFLRKNTIHSFENALLGGCHFSRVPQIGLMSVARFSWVPNLYNIHFLVENHRPQPDPVNSYRDVFPIWGCKQELRYICPKYIPSRSHPNIFQIFTCWYMLVHVGTPHQNNKRVFLLIRLYIY